MTRHKQTILIQIQEVAAAFLSNPGVLAATVSLAVFYVFAVFTHCTLDIIKHIYRQIAWLTCSKLIHLLTDSVIAPRESAACHVRTLPHG